MDMPAPELPLLPPSPAPRYQWLRWLPLVFLLVALAGTAALLACFSSQGGGGRESGAALALLFLLCLLSYAAAGCFSFAAVLLKRGRGLNIAVLALTLLVFVALFLA